MPKKLLLAEDSLTIRKVFELALSRSDIAITAVDNGEDAVRLAGEIFPDLVVADLTLPGKNGFAVAAELRAMEKTEKIPVLILSGTLVPLDEARFKASGARGVLFKPFESRELLENIERLLREGAQVAESPKPKDAPAVDERWDFSDVMDEIESEAGKSAPPAPAAREGLFPGALLPGGGRVPPPFNEFDVSIDEIEGGTREFSAEPFPPAPAPKVEHVERVLHGDSPPPVTDLSPVLDEVEEIEEVENLEDVEIPMPPADAVSTETPASLRILSHAASQTVVDEPVPAPAAAADPDVPGPAAAETAVEETAVSEHPPPEPVVTGQAVGEPPPAPPGTFIAPPDAGSRPGDAELREFFAGRAAEIFRNVASEAVEKVMWEMTDRLAAEFSAKLRESVEAVA
ncbi:MAG: response regulator receiver protein, partial [Deltaproteobacteria bacterium]|nr:response regulator receiver protein [Deltaproteobacteria bacterium]